GHVVAAPSTLTRTRLRMVLDVDAGRRAPGGLDDDPPVAAQVLAQPLDVCHRSAVVFVDGSARGALADGRPRLPPRQSTRESCPVEVAPSTPCGCGRTITFNVEKISRRIALTLISFVVLPLVDRARTQFVWFMSSRYVLHRP